MRYQEREKKNQSQIIYGTRAVLQALANGQELEKILLRKGLQGENVSDIIRQAQQASVPYQFVPREKFMALGDANHQGVLAFVSAISYQKLEDLVPTLFEQGATPLLLILDRVTDVRNFGAICRTALAAGVQAVLIPDRGSAQINEDAMKTSAGALLKLPICRAPNLKIAIEYLKESGIQVLACTEKADTLISQADMKGPTAIIMGSEEEGISHEYMKRSDQRVKIPLLHQMASLNVSVACGIILYEAQRQRLAAPPQA